MATTASLRTLLALALCLGAGLAAPGTAAGALPGVQVHALWGGGERAEIARGLDAARAAGARVVRVDVGWSSLQEHGRGRFSQWYVRRLDALVAEARRRRLRLLVTLTWTPCWASSAPRELRAGCAGAWWDRGVDRYPPRRAGDYAAALAFLVRRYRHRVAGWEIWNEPNAQEAFRSRRPARDYAGLVRAAHRAAKRAYPRARIVAGSLMHADAGFTEALYRAGIRGRFDAFSIHPYSDDRSPLDPAGTIRGSFVRGVPAVRAVMRRHRDRRPLWLTEVGWSTCGVRGEAPWRNCVDERTQAAYAAAALEQASRWRYVRVVVWYGLADTGSDPWSRNANYGLLRADGTRKPAFRSFMRGAARLAR